MPPSDISEDKSPGTTEPGEDVESNASQELIEATPVATTSTAAPEELPEDVAEEAPDLDSRVLCPDGACVGVIGPDGRCKVCGAASDEIPPASAPAGSPPEDPAREDPVAEDSSTADPFSEVPRAIASPAPARSRREDPAPPDFADRKLCSDGECIGVIGNDDRCRECGKPFNGEA